MPRIVCLDTNVVIWGLLADGKAEDDIKRYKAQYLLSELEKEEARVLIPAIVLAEVTAKAEEESKLDLYNALTSSLEILPFCSGCALRYGEVRRKGMKRRSRQFPRKEVTVDSLIISQCIANGVNVLYTDDENLLKLASEFIQAQRLPTPPPQQLEL